MVVWQRFGNDIRIGTVVEQEKGSDGWLKYRIEWHKDELYEESTEWRQRLRNQTWQKIWYRSDEVLPLNVDHINSKILAHQSKYGSNYD